MFVGRHALRTATPRAATIPLVFPRAALPTTACFGTLGARLQSAETPNSSDAAEAAEDTGDASPTTSSEASTESETTATRAAPRSQAARRNGFKSTPPKSSKTSSSSSSPPTAPSGPPSGLPSSLAAELGTEGISESSFGDEALHTRERIASSNADWSTSYYGISTRPATAAQYKQLMTPLESSEIEVKPDGIIYLPEIKYRRRLNAAFGPMGWGLIPRGEPVVGNNIVTREYALIVGGRFVAQAQGENQFFTTEQLPSSVEGCKSNALMRCCKDLGIASELWDPTYIRWFRKTHMEMQWVEHQTTKKKRQMWFRKGAVEVAYPYKLTK